MAIDTQKVSSALFAQVNAIRTARGIGWETLAKEVGFSPATVWRFVAGETLSLRSYLMLQEFVVRAVPNPPAEGRCSYSGCAADITHAVEGEVADVLYCIEHAVAEDEEECPEGQHRMPDGTCMDDEEMSSESAEFDVTGDTTLPVADRDHDWDGLAAKDRIFDKYKTGAGEGKVNVEQISKAFLRKDPKGDPQLKGTWALGFADIIGGTLTIVPAGVAAVAGGHGIGKMKGLQTDEVQQLKNACCDLYSTVAKTHKDWPACPFEREDRNDKQVDIEENAVAAGAGVGMPVEGIIAIEGVRTGDGRMLERGSVQWDDEILPVALIWDRDEGDHSGMTVGSINEVWRDGDEIHAKGFLSNSEDPETMAAVSRVAELFGEGAVGVSVALDEVDVELRVKQEAIEKGQAETGDPFSIEGLEVDEDGYLTLGKVSADEAVEVTTSGNLRHVAVVDTAAIAKAKLRLSVGSEEIVEIAASGSLRIVEFEPDPEAFSDPKFGVPGVDDRLRFDPHANRWSCPPTVDADGRYYGHIAPWGICLRGRPDKCITPPNADLGGFMRGAAPLAGGLRTGVVCVGASHSSTGIGAEAATRHYDKTGRAAADVRVGVDSYGVWFAGRTRPGASAEDLYALMASDVSGHWEVGKNGTMTLCGLPAVNVGGFPKGYMTAAEVAMAASATLEDEDCGCDADEPEVLEAPVTGFSEERFSRLEAALERISMAVAPMYAEHLVKSLPTDDE